MMPSCDQTGVPIHFHSSTTSGSASWMSLRILPRVFPRQSPRSAILLEMSFDAEWRGLAAEFFVLFFMVLFLERGPAVARGSAVPAGDGSRLLDPLRELPLV